MYCNSKNNNKSNVIRLKDDQNNVIMSDKENANLLNNYFSSVFTEDNDSPELIFNSAHKELFDEDLPEPFNFTQQPIKESMPDIDITEEDVLDILKGLDPYKSFSPTCVHPRVLKELAHELTGPIMDILNAQYTRGKSQNLGRPQL